GRRGHRRGDPAAATAARDGLPVQVLDGFQLHLRLDLQQRRQYAVLKSAYAGRDSRLGVKLDSKQESQPACLLNSCSRSRMQRDRLPNLLLRELSADTRLDDSD